MATFPIRLDVEEIALGTVLRRLNAMPGIVRLHLDMGRGGEGAGRAGLEKAASANGEFSKQVLAHLAKGPRTAKELNSIVGGRRQRVYGVLHTLKRKGLIRAGKAKNTHEIVPVRKK